MYFIGFRVQGSGWKSWKVRFAMWAPSRFGTFGGAAALSRIGGLVCRHVCNVADPVTVGSAPELSAAYHYGCLKLLKICFPASTK